MTIHHYNSHGFGKKSKSPLLLAASAGHVTKIKTLLSFGLELSTADEEGNSVIHCAAMENRHAVIKEFQNKVRFED